MAWFSPQRAGEAQWPGLAQLPGELALFSASLGFTLCSLCDAKQGEEGVRCSAQNWETGTLLSESPTSPEPQSSDSTSEPSSNQLTTTAAGDASSLYQEKLAAQRQGCQGKLPPRPHW